MKVTVNHKEHEIKQDTTVRELLNMLGYGTAVVFINDRKLRMDEYDGTLKENDLIKIIRILGGG